MPDLSHLHLSLTHILVMHVLVCIYFRTLCFSLSLTCAWGCQDMVWTWSGGEGKLGNDCEER
jgi:hypothetical protein